MSFPKFISDSPKGEDLFYGKPQEKIAKAVIKYMEDNPSTKKRVIGIEGEWGSGKSNVIEIIKKLTANKYHIFTFDTWGHQEDLTRRTFLEELTEDLIYTGALKNKWKTTLKEKLATNKITTVRANPSFNPILVLGGALLIVFPWVKLLLEYLFVRYGYSNFGLGPLICSVLIYLVVIPVIWRSRERLGMSRDLTWGEVLYLYQGKEITTNIHETITQLEPSVSEFRNILNEIVGDLNKDKELVFVFDNMDRLPSNKIREIWSSVHTFFADIKNHNYQSWVLIPYDATQLGGVFADDDSDGQSKSYIQKTFAISFRVSPPILTHWKDYLTTKFEEAFGYKPKAEDHIANIFDYLHQDATIKPREIINYVNDLVALNQQWGAQIPLKYCALFILTKDAILLSPTRAILDKQFLAGAYGLFQADENVERYVSALTFNVPLEDAEDVLLRRSVERALRGDFPLQDLSSGKAFYKVLDSCFYAMEIDCDMVSTALNTLPKEIRISSDFQHFWLSVLIAFERTKFETREQIERVFKGIILNLTDFKQQEKLVKHLVNVEYNSFSNKTEIKGAELAKQIDTLIEYLNDNNISIDPREYLHETFMSPGNYIEFVINCKGNFDSYHVNYDVVKLNEFLIQRFPLDILLYEDFLAKIKEHIDLSALKNHICSVLSGISVESPQHAETLTCAIRASRTLGWVSDVSRHIAAHQAYNMIRQNPDAAFLWDLAYCLFRSEEFQNYNNDELINSILQQDAPQTAIEIFYDYLTFDELLLLTALHPFRLFKQLLKVLSKNFTMPLVSNLKDILINYEKIKLNALDDQTELLNAFLTNLNTLESEFRLLSENHGLLARMPLSFLKDYESIPNNIRELLHQEELKYLQEADEDEWLSAFQNGNSNVLFQLLDHLLSSTEHSIVALSKKCTEAYKKVIQHFFETKTYPTNLALWNQILEKVDRGLLMTRFVDLRDSIIYSADPPSEETLRFFRSGLFSFGELNDQNHLKDVVRKIILPILRNDNCLLELTDAEIDMVEHILAQTPEFLEEAHIELLNSETHTDQVNRLNNRVFALLSQA